MLCVGFQFSLKKSVFVYTFCYRTVMSNQKRLIIAEKCAIVAAYDTTGAGHMTITELANKQGVSKPTISYILKDKEKFKKATKEGPPAKCCNTRAPMKFSEIEQPKNFFWQYLCETCQENGAQDVFWSKPQMNRMRAGCRGGERGMRSIGNLTWRGERSY